MEFIFDPTNYRILVLVIGALFIMYERSNWGLITKTIIPFYDELESKYGAKHPVVIDKILYPFADVSNSTPYFALKKSCFFVDDSNFVIISMLNKNSFIKIPFGSIDYHDSSIIGSTYQNRYYYRIELHFSYNNRQETFAFTTLRYSHALDKKYGKRLTGEELFSFIQSNFFDEEEYEKMKFIAELEQEYSAKFPILIVDGDSDLPDWQPPKHNGNSYAFLLDDKVVIKSSLDSNLNIEIPYNEILRKTISYFNHDGTYYIHICGNHYEFKFDTAPLDSFQKQAGNLHVNEFVRELKSLGK